MKKLTKGLIASIIIITIAGLAFATGFLKESKITQIEGIKVAIAEDEILVERLDAKISDVLLMDYLKISEAGNLKQNARLYAIEIDKANDTLTPAELDTLYGLIQNSLNRYEELVRETSFWFIAEHFDKDLNESDYYFAIEKNDGYEFSISMDDFYDTNTSKGLVYFEHQSTFLANFPGLIDLIYNTTFTHGNTFTRTGSIDNWATLYRNEIREVLNQIEYNSLLLADFESIASYYSYGVTLITVATILASAMAAQINDKEREKEFSHIKANIYDDEKLIITQENNYAIPVLIVALVISALGLIIPLIFGLIY